MLRRVYAYCICLVSIWFIVLPISIAIESIVGKNNPDYYSAAVAISIIPLSMTFVALYSRWFITNKMLLSNKLFMSYMKSALVVNTAILFMLLCLYAYAFMVEHDRDVLAFMLTLIVCIVLCVIAILYITLSKDSGNREQSNSEGSHTD